MIFYIASYSFIYIVILQDLLNQQNEQLNFKLLKTEKKVSKYVP